MASLQEDGFWNSSGSVTIKEAAEAPAAEASSSSSSSSAAIAAPVDLSKAERVVSYHVDAHISPAQLEKMNNGHSDEIRMSVHNGFMDARPDPLDAATGGDRPELLKSLVLKDVKCNTATDLLISFPTIPAAPGEQFKLRESTKSDSAPYGVVTGVLRNGTLLERAVTPEKLAFAQANPHVTIASTRRSYERLPDNGVRIATSPLPIYLDDYNNRDDVKSNPDLQATPDMLAMAPKFGNQIVLGNAFDKVHEEAQKAVQLLHEVQTYASVSDPTTFQLVIRPAGPQVYDSALNKMVPSQISFATVVTSNTRPIAQMSEEERQAVKRAMNHPIKMRFTLEATYFKA